MKIYLVRHAESIGNISPSFNGQKDVPLSENGRKQATLLRKFFENVEIDKIYTSTLKRTIETADLAIPGKRDTFISLDSIREINGGDWEGRHYDEIFEKWGDEFRKWRETPHEAQPPNGENIYDVFDRVTATLEKITSENAGDSTIAIFAHGAVIKTIIAFIRSLPLSSLTDIAWYENSSVTEIIYEDGLYRLGFYDNHEHLPKHIKTVENSNWGRTMKAACRY